MRAIFLTAALALVSCGPGVPKGCPATAQPCTPAGGSYQQDCFPNEQCCGGIASYTDGTGVVQCGLLPDGGTPGV